MNRAASLVVAAVLLAACARKPESPATTRPEWRTATIDGIAPLMSPRQVGIALDRGGYVQVPCTSRDKLLVRPLDSGGEMPCYRSPTRPMTVSLYFLDLHEGRRLAVVNFHRFDLVAATDAERLAASEALARRLRARFGQPSVTMNESVDYHSFYWNRSGGQPQQPDTISTTVGRSFTPGITMTSMWAYGEVRPDRP